MTEMSRRRVAPIARVVALLVVAGGCGKTPKEPPPPVVWHPLAEGEPLARSERRLALLHFGADWSMADLEIERETIASDEVRAELRDWVVIKVDLTEDGPREVFQACERFKVVGTPTTFAVDFETGRELFRFNEAMPPPVLAKALRDARARWTRPAGR